MIAVDHYFCVWKTYTGDFSEVRIHIDHYVFYIFSVFKTAEVLDQVALLTVRQYICYPLVVRICHYGLELLPAGITFEFVYGQNLRELLAGVTYELEIP